MTNKPELLAPAGSIEAFHAAYRAGADAFYMGLGDFNARKRAKNFSREEMKSALLFAHRHDKKIYIAMNTLLFDEEMPGVIDALNFLEEARADGVIVQDMGLISIIKKHFPGLPVHASTQMFCHNRQQAAFLRDLGVSRIILPRELAIPEIAGIMRSVPLEYEIFIHGAMCFSFSGCCLFSSYLFGESGNRGRCRQPCRYPCRENNETRYPFSMRDLSAADDMKELLALGLSAFKIEGRLKNAEYVHKTVSRYRSIIDAAARGPESALKMRENGSGYFKGWSYEKLVNDRTPGTTGEIVGEVSSVEGTACTITVREPLRKGMRLRLADEDGRKVREGTLLKFMRKSEFVYEWDTGEHIPLGRRLFVYHTGESVAFRGHDEIMHEAEGAKYIPVRCEVVLDERRLELRLEADGFPALVSVADVEAQPAEKRALSEETVEEIFRQVDRYPFDIRSMRVTVQPDIFVPLGGLKQLRREAYRELMGRHEERLASRNAARMNAVLAELRDIGVSAAGDEKVSIRYAGPDDRPGDGDFSVMEFEDVRDGEGVGAGTVIRLPLFVPEDGLADTQARVRTLIEAGYKRFMVPVYGWMDFFREHEAVELFGGPLLYVVNSFAYRLLYTGNLRYFTVSGDMEQQAVTVSYRGYITPRSFPVMLMAARLRLPRDTCSIGGSALRVRHFHDYDEVYRDDI